MTRPCVLALSAFLLLPSPPVHFAAQAERAERRSTERAGPGNGSAGTTEKRRTEERGGEKMRPAKPAREAATREIPGREAPARESLTPQTPDRERAGREDPTYGGQTIEDWTDFVDHPEPEIRARTVRLLGEIGAPAEPALPAVEKACKDKDARVRMHARQAVQKIEADLARQPPAAQSADTGSPEPGARPAGPGARPAKEPEEGPPEGRIFYVSGIHEVSDEGAVLKPIRNRQADEYTAYVFGMAANLNYLDLAEVWRYRKDAEERNLPTARAPLEELMRTDPLITEKFKQYRLYKTYKKDHVVRLTCNGQTRYQYRRFDSEGGLHNHGGGKSIGMTPGRYPVKVSCFTIEGFRLDYDFTFDFSVKVDPEKEQQAKRIRAPRDVGKENRRLLAAPLDPERKGELAYRAGYAHSLARELCDAAKNQIRYRAATYNDVLPFLKEAAYWHRWAMQKHPAGGSNAVKHMKFLVGACSMTGDIRAYPLAVEVLRMADTAVSGFPPDTAKGHQRWAWWDRNTCHLSLGMFAMRLGNNVDTFWREYEEGFRHAGKVGVPYGSGWQQRPIDMAGKRDTWPQRGWWRSSWGELPDLASLEGDEREDPKEEVEGAKPEQSEAIDKLADELLERLAELDEERSSDLTWLKGIGDELAAAEKKKAIALGQLRVLQDAAKKILFNINKLKTYLARTPSTPSDDYLEDFWRWLLETDAELPHTRSPKSGAQMRDVIRKQMTQLRHELSDVRREQDTIIAGVLQTYQNIIDESELKGDKSKWQEIREASEKGKQHIRDRLTFIKVELYFSSGQTASFQNAVRTCRDENAQKAEIDTVGTRLMLMQAVHLLDNNKPRAALRALRAAAETEFFDINSAQADQLLRSLEVGYLQAIAGKSVGEAAGIRRKFRRRMGSHGEEGFFGYLKDVFTTGVGESMAALGDTLEKRYEEHGVGPIGSARVIIDAVTGKPVAGDGGKHEAMARFTGTVAEEAAAQQIGLMLITRFRDPEWMPRPKGSFSWESFRRKRDRDMPAMSLHDIKNMSLQDVIAKSKEIFGRDIAPAEAMRMRAAMHLAFQNPDVKRLLEDSVEQLDVDTGKAYEDSEILDMTVGDWIGDAVNVQNVLLFAGPSAVVSAGGKAAGVGYWGVAGGRAPVDLITAKEAFTAAVRLPEIVEKLNESKIGSAVIQKFMQYHKSTGFVGHRAADFLVQFYASEAAGAAGRGAAAFFGGDKETQERLGRAAELLADAVTALGVGDYDTMADLIEEKAFTGRDAQKIARALAEMAGQAQVTSAKAQKLIVNMDGVIKELAEGQLSANTRQTVKKTLAEIQEEADGLIKAFEKGEGTPDLVQRYKVLRTAHQGLAAARYRMGDESRLWREMLGDLKNGVDANAKALSDQSASVRRLGSHLSGGAGTPPPSSYIEPKHMDFRKNWVGREADRDMLEGRLDRAVRRYEEAQTMCQELGLNKRRITDELASKLDYAKKQLAESENLRLARLGPEVNARAFDDIGDDEITKLMKNPDIEFRKVGSGVSEPLWVIDKKTQRKLYVFKPEADQAKFPRAAVAEEVSSKLAKELGIPTPAAICTEIDMPGRGKVKGALVRVVEGDELLDCDDAYRVALKEEIARDWVLRAFLGDYDGHAKNFRVATDGRLVGFDHNLANLDEGNPAAIYRVIGQTQLSADPARRTAQIAQLMEDRVHTMFKTDRKIYEAMVPVARQITFEDMQATVRKIQALSPEVLEKCLKPHYGARTKDVMEILESRRECLEDVMRKFFKPVEQFYKSTFLRHGDGPLRFTIPWEVPELAAA